MSAIFWLSHQPAEDSGRLSVGIAETIAKAVKIVFPAAHLDIEALNCTIRKTTHFLAYLILGLLVTNALKSSAAYGYKRIISALLICVFYAASDETHQAFVPGRSAEAMDLFIDGAGAAFGIGVFYIFDKGVLNKLRKFIR